MTHTIKISKSTAKAIDNPHFWAGKKIELTQMKWYNLLQEKGWQMSINRMFKDAIEHINSGASIEATHIIDNNVVGMRVFLIYKSLQKDYKWHFEIIIPQKYLCQELYTEIFSE